MIPYLDLKAQYQSIRKEMDEAVLRVIASGGYVLGEEVASFEKEFAAYCGTAGGVGVNSGTSALHLALLAIGVGPGDEVITTPFTFVASVLAIEYAGARPVLADIDPATLNLDPSLLRAAITKNTKAILPVHLHGRPADMNAITSIAREAGVKVIEDAAQAHGADVDGKLCGSIGDLGCFSFYPGKNLGAYGEGGFVSTSNPEYEQTIRELRDYGQQGKYNHVRKGFNYRLESLQAAILRVKLRHLHDWTEARRRLARLYDELLEDSGVDTPQATPGHVYHVYAIRTPNRDRLQAYLREQEIPTLVHYPAPVHLLESHRDLGYAAGAFPHSEAAAREVLSLPLYPEMTDEHVRTVADAIRRFHD